MQKQKQIIRDLSWLSFNSRVLQEAEDNTVPLKERIRFLGIYSNNMDEFFRVRVATLKRMSILGAKADKHLQDSPDNVLDQIQEEVISMQSKFDKVWTSLKLALKDQKIQLLNERQLNAEQRKFALLYYEDKVRSHIAPLMIENMAQTPTLNDKALYLACTLSKKDDAEDNQYALVSVPTKHLSRFLILPSRGKTQFIILLEDVIRLALPRIFSIFSYDKFSSYVIKLTRDAELDIDNDLSSTLMQKIEKGLKKRKKGKPVRFVYDRAIDAALLRYLIGKFGLSQKDNLIPGGRIHNFKDFMNFPDIISEKSIRKQPFIHPLLSGVKNISALLQQRDILLNTPYHSFDSIIDLLREAAIDPEVNSIKITCYRLAENSKIINALINASRNGKKVTVMLELRARFDEEANLKWKTELEEEGIQVLIGVPGMKVHAKLCVIKKTKGKRHFYYGFVGTGNLNESTARIYCDHFLLTSNKSVMADIVRIFKYLEHPDQALNPLKECKTLLVSPVSMRQQMELMVEKEIHYAKKGKPASIQLKLNSLSDSALIEKLSQAAAAGVEIHLIVRGIFCMFSENKRYTQPVQAISIVDEYLEHARIIIFHNNGKEKIFLSSADWMIRNLDYRIEAACCIDDPGIAQELKEIIKIQLQDNVKARVLNNKLDNQHVRPGIKKRIRAQISIYQYLKRKQYP